VPGARGATTPRATAAAQAKVPVAPLRLRVSLLNVEPPVWREVCVPGDLTFARLHAVLQAAMGWEDCHMHEFRVAEERIGMPGPAEFFADDDPLHDERTTRVRELLGKRRKFRYWYDFGDDWWHEITVVGGTDAGSALGLLAGEGACPPEDCGGPWGYGDMLLTLADPTDPEYEAMREWAGDLDPLRFDLDAAARAVAKAIKRAPGRK
jgi:hypothetical protein